MKQAVIAALLFLSAFGAYGQETSCTITIRNVRKNGGKVYVAVYESAESYKAEKIFRGLVLDASDSILTACFQLPAGYYVFSLFQDLNANGVLDMNFLGMPKEPFGLSNYEGKGIPGGFDRQKVRVEGGECGFEMPLIRLLG